MPAIFGNFGDFGNLLQSVFIRGKVLLSRSRAAQALLPCVDFAFLRVSAVSSWFSITRDVGDPGDL
jgi:hypothetical protein